MPKFDDAKDIYKGHDSAAHGEVQQQHHNSDNNNNSHFCHYHSNYST
jgi:hypothetical protein